ncbi:hypothetical protein VTI74DRAFT_11625 [Chaetomium olivicolor]
MDDSGSFHPRVHQDFSRGRCTIRLCFSHPWPDFQAPYRGLPNVYLSAHPLFLAGHRLHLCCRNKGSCPRYPMFFSPLASGPKCYLVGHDRCGSRRLTSRAQPRTSLAMPSPLTNQGEQGSDQQPCALSGFSHRPTCWDGQALDRSSRRRGT